MNPAEPASVPSNQAGPSPGQLRLAVAACLARFKGTSREHTESDLRCYLLVGDLPRRPWPRRVRQALQPILREPDAPLPDHLPRDIEPGRDRRQRHRPGTLRAGQHDPRPLDNGLGRLPLADQLLQGLALSASQQQRGKLRARHPKPTTCNDIADSGH